VSRCGVEQVLSMGGAVFMLYYEHVLPLSARVPDGAGVLAGAEAGNSAETVRPAHATASGNRSGSGVGLASGFGGGEAVARVRVVRSVSLGMGSRTSVSASSLSVLLSSLRSVPSTSPSPGPATPRTRAADANADESGGAAVVEPLALVSVGKVNGDRDGDGALLAPALPQLLRLLFTLLYLLPLFAVFSDERVLERAWPRAAHLQHQGERAPRIAPGRAGAVPAALRGRVRGPGRRLVFVLACSPLLKINWEEGEERLRMQGQGREWERSRVCLMG
jgi:hypothetical protein